MWSQNQKCSSVPGSCDGNKRVIIHHPWTAPHFPRTIPNDIGWEKILDVLHSHIDRPTPQLHCIDKFEESHAYFILTLVFLCPNRTLHQLGLNEILVIPAAGTRNMGVTQHCIYFMKTHICLSKEYWHIQNPPVEMILWSTRTVPIHYFITRPGRNNLLVNWPWSL